MQTTMSKNLKKVLIADDHNLFRIGFNQLITAISGFEVIGETANGEETLQFIKSHQPDIVTLDLGLYGFPGYSIIREIKAINEKTKILVVSMHDEISIIKQTIREGADGFLTKNSSAEEVGQAFKKIANNQHYLSSKVAEQVAFYQLNDEYKKELSSREREILKLIVIDGLSLVDIAHHLKVSPKTVTSHKTHIMEKLNVETNLELIKIGLKLINDF